MNLDFGELLAAVFAQQAHRIGPTLTAVAHQLHIAGALVLNRFQLFGGGAGLAVQAKVGAVLRGRDQGHDVVEERPPSSDGFIHFRHVFVVDAGDENRIHFAKNVGFFEGLQAFHLPLVEDLHPFQTAVALAAVVHPGVDFHPNFRVHHINGNGDVVNVEAA